METSDMRSSVEASHCMDSDSRYLVRRLELHQMKKETSNGVGSGGASGHSYGVSSPVPGIRERSFPFLTWDIFERFQRLVPAVFHLRGRFDFTRYRDRETLLATGFQAKR